MHELAIAQDLIEKAVALVPPHAQNITLLKIQFGALAGVSEAELRFGFEVVAAQTPCADATLEIEHCPAKARCSQCNLVFTVADNTALVCPSCNMASLIVTEGKEILITSLEATVEAAYG